MSGLRVIVAHGRAARPGGWLAGSDRARPDLVASDPFAEGNESATPPEVDAVRPGGSAPDTPGWQVRVVPNKFPALVPAGEGGPARPVDGSNGTTLELDPFGGRGEVELFAAAPAVGAHEVIVNSPRPVTTLATLAVEELRVALSMWQRRMRINRSRGYPQLIVNEGRAAGASLAHTHAQLYVLPFLPQLVARERERFTAYYERTQGRNLLADLVQAEVRTSERVVWVDEQCVAFCPFAARAAFHVVIAPRRPAARFEDDEPPARALAATLKKLRHACGGDPPLNLFVRTAPDGAQAFCWRIELLPRLAQPAGLELSAGVHVCPLAPERAAALLRAADPKL